MKTIITNDSKMADLWIVPLKVGKDVDSKSGSNRTSKPSRGKKKRAPKPAGVDAIFAQSAQLSTLGEAQRNFLQRVANQRSFKLEKGKGIAIDLPVTNDS